MNTLSNNFRDDLPNVDVPWQVGRQIARPARVFSAANSLAVAADDQGMLRVYLGEVEVFSQPSGHTGGVNCLAPIDERTLPGEWRPEGTSILWELDQEVPPPPASATDIQRDPAHSVRRRHQ